MKWCLSYWSSRTSRRYWFITASTPCCVASRCKALASNPAQPAHFLRRSQSAIFYFVQQAGLHGCRLPQCSRGWVSGRSTRLRQAQRLYRCSPRWPTALRRSCSRHQPRVVPPPPPPPHPPGVARRRNPSARRRLLTPGEPPLNSPATALGDAKGREAKDGGNRGRGNVDVGADGGCSSPMPLQGEG